MRCLALDCYSSARARGYCKKHYNRLMRYGRIETRIAPKGTVKRGVCSVNGCYERDRYKGLCGKHYKRLWRHGNPTHTDITMHKGEKCSVDNCDRVAEKTMYCAKHYGMLLRYGRTDNIIASRGEGHPVSSAGYVLITVDGKRKYEHIHLAEKALGKPLPKGAIVHHFNNNSTDNHTLFNLIVCPDQAYHMLIHKRTREYEQFGYVK